MAIVLKDTLRIWGPVMVTGLAASPDTLILGPDANGDGQADLYLSPTATNPLILG